MRRTKRHLAMLASILALLCVVSLVAGCNTTPEDKPKDTPTQAQPQETNDATGQNNSSPTVKEHTVTFMADGVTVATEKYSDTDKSINLPQVPKKAGYIGIWESYVLDGKDMVINAVYCKASQGLEFELDAEGSSYIVKSMGGCNDIDVVIPEEHEGKAVGAIGERAFYKKSSIKSVIIPNTITSIDIQAFDGCTSLENIVIPDSVTSIGDSAFANCTRLSSAFIGKGVEKLGLSAFSFNTGITTLLVDAGNATYHSDENCIIKTQTKELVMGCKSSVIPADGSVVNIGAAAFHGCVTLESIIIPDCIEGINTYAFFCCSGLTSVVFGKDSKLKMIGKYAFEDCVALSSIELGENLREISDDAFNSCEALKSVTLGSGITRFGTRAFYGCTALSKITFNGTSEQWEAIKKGDYWNNTTGAYTVQCTDKTLQKGAES